MSSETAIILSLGAVAVVLAWRRPAQFIEGLGWLFLLAVFAISTSHCSSCH